MKMQQIKNEMKAYRDFFGGDLICLDEIDKAKSKSELAEILNKHDDYLEDQLSDAKSHLSNFRREIGLNNY